LPMSDKHDEWVARAREVATALAVDAVERDRANAEPSAEVKLLKSAGLLALLIPEDLGGAGQTWRTALAVVRAIAAAGITFGRDWDNLGQRLSASGSVTFTNTPVPAEDVIGPLGPAVTPLASAITPAIQAVFGHLYLGIAEGALRTARTYTLSTSRPWVLGGHDTVIDEPYVLAQYGDFDARLAAVGALADKAAAALTVAIGQGSALTWAERGELEIEIARLKVVATDTALDVTSKIFELTGARSTASKHGFDRFWRNVRTHTLHDPVAYKRREVGLHYLTGETPRFTLYT
jgi:alkylation response protein AidB-like acyl-CoA dehydrogenase